MRNLKRVLSLAMAAAMLIGMMVISASAASTYDNFTDKDDIVNTEAVNTMVSLGVINGKDDGSYFDPAGIVTRAEMAALIARSLNGGVDPSLGTGAATTQFSDTKGHWAEAYIAYCANLGIINGKGDGTFGPDEQVTGTAAAKMFLCALGYRSEIEGLTGAGWDLNTDSLANKAGLYEDLTGLRPSDGLNRDNTAQLVYNGVQAQEVQYRNNYGEYSGVIYPQPNGTMLANRFGVIKVEGVAVANEIFAVDGGSRTVAGRTRLTDTNTYSTSAGVVRNYNGTYPVSVSNELIGQRIVLYVKFPNALSPNAATSVVIGEPIISNDNTVATTGAKMKDEAAVKSFVSQNGMSISTSYKGEAGAYGMYTASYNESKLLYSSSEGRTARPAASQAVTYNQWGDKTKTSPGIEQVFIDHNGDGVVDFLIQYIDKMARVSVYDEKNEKLTIAGEGSIDFAKIVGYEDVAKDDLVLYHKLEDTYYVYKAETVTGQVTAYNSGNSNISIDGTSYGQSAVDINSTGTTVDRLNNFEVTVGDEYTLYLDRFGNCVAAQLSDASVGNYALVMATEATGNLVQNGKVRLLMADGTTGVYDVNMVATYNALINKNDALKTAYPAADSSNGAKEDEVRELFNATNTASIQNWIVTAAVGADGKVTLGMAGTGNYAESQNNTTHTGDSYLAGRSHNQYTFTGVSGSIVPNSSTVYFFRKGSTVSVVVGLDSLASEIKNTTVKGAVFDSPATNAGNKYYARALYVDGTYKGASNFLYVSSDYTLTLDDNNNKVWNYDVVYTDGTTGTIKTLSDSYGKGQIYEYTTDGNGMVTLEQPLNDDGNPICINGYVTTAADRSIVRVVKGIYTNTSATAYTLSNSVSSYNVEDAANLYEETLSGNMTVALGLDGDGYVRCAFIKETNVDVYVDVIGSFTLVDEDGNDVVCSGGCQVASGFDARIKGSAVNYTIAYENGDDPVTKTATGTDGFVKIPVDAYTNITINSVTP